ncbi:hypothetical protein ACJ73_07098 [Blastomyces percursus]|uniref:TIGR00267 family protein n=1 Tax=Blastomyces percursus TaxID=1658174 RepID=A0A1J9R0J4_9EURO|nr:hypothetical protein ACJ73_07098 [Blastomyces percursus]
MAPSNGSTPSGGDQFSKHRSSSQDASKFPVIPVPSCACLDNSYENERICIGEPLLPRTHGKCQRRAASDPDPEAQDWLQYRTVPCTRTRSNDSDESQASRSRVNPRVISDAILGLSDGLTVPFALSAGLSAFGNTKVVVLGSLAELVAGAISMGLGGYVGARSEIESYETAKREVTELVSSCSCETTSMVREVFAPYSLPDHPVSEMSSTLHSSPKQLMEFLLAFYHKQPEPDRNQAYISAVTLAIGYFVGGFIPLIPYIICKRVLTALKYSVGVMVITLLVFGYIKTCIVRGWKGRDNVVAGLKGGVQMVLVGGVAAGAAVGLVRLINNTEHGG